MYKRQALGLLNTNALTASDAVLIPVQCEYYALEGLTQLLNTILLTQKVFNEDLTIEGVLLTMLDSRTNLGIEVSQEVRKYFREKVYDCLLYTSLTGGDWRAAIWGVISLFVAGTIYYPFFKIMEKQRLELEAGKEK